MTNQMKTLLAILVPLIQDSEHCKLKAYPDAATGGVPWSIGWGATQGVKKGDVWTQAQADERLQQDALHALDRAVALSPILSKPGYENQWAAVADFIYNAGEGRYAGSTFRKNVDGEYWNLAAKECEKWCHGHDSHGELIELEGLVVRRAKEAHLLAGF